MSCLQGFVGLQNIGLNCYANCIVQCLVAIPQMASFFLSSAPVHGPGQKQRPISMAFSHLLHRMWASNNSAVDPHRLADFSLACYSGYYNQLLTSPPLVSTIHVHPLRSTIHVHHWCPPFMSTTGIHHLFPLWCPPFMSPPDVYHSCPPPVSTIHVHHWCPPFMSPIHVPDWCPPFMSTTGVHHSCSLLLVHPLWSITMQVHGSLCQG